MTHTRFGLMVIRLLPWLTVCLMACSTSSVPAGASATMTSEATPRYPTLRPSPSTSVRALQGASPFAAESSVPASPAVITAAHQVPSPSMVASRVPVVVAQASPGVVASPVSEVDARMSGMTREDKVGQLFMLGFPGDDPAAALPLFDELRAGGIVLTTNVTSADAAQRLTGALQRSAIASGLAPLLISVNHEGGDVQPIRVGMTYYGPQWDVGLEQPLSRAIADACTRGTVHGQQLAAIGINMNLAPDLDVLDNPANTVIGQRAFSSDPQVVAQLGAAYIEGLQRQGVLAVGKHFPGHGSSTADSHQALPVIQHDRAWLDSHELVPFKAAIQANVAAIMVGHLSFPLVDSMPSSLSSVFVDGILRTDLSYGGLVVTDDVGQMKAITAGYTPGVAAVQALVAGSDVVLTVGPLQSEREMVAAVLAAIPSIISEERLDASVRRVLTAKIQARLLDGTAPTLTPGVTVCQT